MNALRFASVLALALPALAQSQLVVVTKDGQRHAFNLPDVLRIEFGTAPAPPPPPPTPTGRWSDAFVGGKVLSGEAHQGGKVWPFRIHITSYSAASGDLVGEVTWTNLSSTHRIRGKLRGASLNFTEVEAIRPGSAHLNVAYTFTVSASGAKGTWVDQGDRSTGEAVIFDR